MSENKETYESVVQQRDELEKKLADVAAESNAIKDAAKSLLSEASIVYSKYNDTQQPDKDLVDMQTLHELQVAMNETPATDVFTRELMAKGVEDAAVSLFGAGYPFDLLMGYVAQLRKGINDAQ